MPRKPSKQSKAVDALIEEQAATTALALQEDVPNAALFPYNSRWEGPQRDHVYIALIECNNSADQALEILRERAMDDVTVRVPTVGQILKMRKENQQEYMEAIWDQSSLTRLMKLIRAADDPVALSAVKYQGDRTYGQPTKRIEIEKVESLSALEARMRSAGAIPDLPPLPAEEWTEGHSEEKIVANPTETLDRDTKV